MKKALLIAKDRSGENPNNVDKEATRELIGKFSPIVSRYFTIRVVALMKVTKKYIM